MKTVYGLLLVFFAGFYQVAKADSPLTSTSFYEAYQHEAIIKYALSLKGQADDQIFDYLENKTISYDKKAALINALGWETKTQRAEKYLIYLGQETKINSFDKLLKKGSAEQLINYAYLYALENYEDVSQVVSILESKKIKKAKSFSVQIVAALIKSQHIFDSSWCDVFKTTDAVRNNTTLKKDMNEQGVNIIFGYMDLYKEYCKEDK